MHKEDPPLGHGAPKPSQHNVRAGDTIFGFQASAAPRAPAATLECGPTVTKTSSNPNKRVAESQKHLALPTSKAKISDHFQLASQIQKPKQVPQEVVPDSEEEQTQGQNENRDGHNSHDGHDGNSYNDNMGHTDSSSEDDSQYEGNSKASQEEHNLDLEQQEHDMDPYANFQDDGGLIHNQGS
jgi:hypothetical protein